MPAHVSERVHALFAGEWEPPALRDATTVVLLRDHDALETFLMRRVSTMAFAAGMYVFPGGRIDDADLASSFEWTGEPVDAERMTAADDLARGLIVCAVRELFEETGVLLAVDQHGRIPEEDERWEDDRAAVHASSDALASVLARRGLALDPGLLPLWTHWVTPEIESRRYDVRFFVATVPTGQRVRDVSGEADDVRWERPGDAIAAYADGRLPMLPPTAATILDLTHFSDASSVLATAASRDVRPLMPRARLDDSGAIAWEIIDVRDGSVILPLDSEPAGSEVHGAGAP
ncbi:MAG: NUDIX domain-containing protein [Actinomycetales bacterium]|nr:NUDIX domain-containing protein [Actinomycetales bacterium]